MWLKAGNPCRFLRSFSDRFEPLVLSVIGVQLFANLGQCRLTLLIRNLLRRRSACSGFLQFGLQLFELNLLVVVLLHEWNSVLWRLLACVFGRTGCLRLSSRLCVGQLALGCSFFGLLVGDAATLYAPADRCKGPAQHSAANEAVQILFAGFLIRQAKAGLQPL